MSDDRKKKLTEPVKIEMTPMIDVVFLLLVFFMITMKFRVSEGFLEARLPTDAGQVISPPTAPETVNLRLALVEAKPRSLVTLSRLGHALPADAMDGPSTFRVRFFLGEVLLMDLVQQTTISNGNPATTVALYSRGRSIANAAVLHSHLTKFRRNAKERPLKIDPDRGVPYSALVTALEAGRRAGYTDVRFAGDTRKPRQQ